MTEFMNPWIPEPQIDSDSVPATHLSIAYLSILLFLPRTPFVFVIVFLSECPSRTYKRTLSNSACSICPANSNSSNSRHHCQCNSGYYRGPSDNKEGKCTGIKWSKMKDPRSVYFHTCLWCLHFINFFWVSVANSDVFFLNSNSKTTPTPTPTPLKKSK